MSDTDPNVVSDTCGVGDYQDVTEFVPGDMEVTSSDLDAFTLSDGSVCVRDDLAFTCDTHDVSESALSGTATLEITSTLSGTIVDEENLNVSMDVTIESCEGVGCWMIELALTWPCPIELGTGATLN